LTLDSLINEETQKVHSQSIYPKINFYSLFKLSTGLAVAALKA
jgi:hypothetical protein